MLFTRGACARRLAGDIVHNVPTKPLIGLSRSSLLSWMKSRLIVVSQDAFVRVSSLKFIRCVGGTKSCKFLFTSEPTRGTWLHGSLRILRLIMFRLQSRLRQESFENAKYHIKNPKTIFGDTQSKTFWLVWCKASYALLFRPVPLLNDIKTVLSFIASALFSGLQPRSLLQLRNLRLKLFLLPSKGFLLL